MNNKPVPSTPPDWEWIDGQQVMQMLNIKKSTLKYLRQSGKISYSSLVERGKLFYSLTELKAALEDNKRRKIKEQEDSRG